MKKIIALAVATAISAPAMADLTIGASGRYQIDNGANATTNTDDTTATTNRILVSVNGSSTAESGLYAAVGGTMELTTAGGVGQDGGVTFTIGNEMANVVLGRGESAGVFSKGPDTFMVGGTGLQERVEGREASNVIVNVTAVENLTAQVAGNLNNDNLRLVLGYDFGAFAVSAGIDNADDASATVDATQVKVTTTLGGVGLSASHESQDNATDDNFTAVTASYMGFGLGFMNSEVNNADEDAVYGNYAIANAGGLEGLTVTVGAGSADDLDTKYGVRLDYAF